MKDFISERISNPEIINKLEKIQEQEQKLNQKTQKNPTS